MSWSFIFKNILFIALLAIPYILSDLLLLKVSMSLGPHHWVLDFEKSWIALVAFFWGVWLCALCIKKGVSWLLRIETPETAFVNALIEFDNNDHQRLQKRFSLKNIRKYPWLAMLNLRYNEKAPDSLFQDALGQAQFFDKLSCWTLQQQIKRDLEKEKSEQAFERLKNLFDNNDRSPWTLERLFYCALSEGETELAQKVLQTARKKNNYANISNWEGELLFHKAKEWAGSLKKKIWLLEKALILLPQKVEIFRDLADLYLEENNEERAKQILRSGWQVKPDLCLVDLFCKLSQKETKTERFEAAKEVVDARNDPLSLLLIAFSGLQADLKPFVTECSEKLKNQGYTSWSFYLESQIELKKIQRHDQALFLSYQCIYALDPVIKSFVQHFSHDTFVAHMDRGNVCSST